MPNSPISDPKIYRVIGLMSGTSLDGVDAAVIETDGQNVVRTGGAVSIGYSAQEKKALSDVTAKALAWNFNGAPPVSFKAIEPVIHRTHLAAVRALLKHAELTAKNIDLIGLHGQTVLHRPSATRQGKLCSLAMDKLWQTRLGLMWPMIFAAQMSPQAGKAHRSRQFTTKP